MNLFDTVYVGKLSNFITEETIITAEKIKEYLIQIAGSINRETRLDDIYEQLAFLNDIDE